MILQCGFQPQAVGVTPTSGSNWRSSDEVAVSVTRLVVYMQVCVYAGVCVCVCVCLQQASALCLCVGRGGIFYRPA